MAKAAPRKKAANGYKLAAPLPKGEILQDVAKNKWKLGPSIGQGGFGEIYSAQDANSKGAKYPYVIKIEPHTNGPLFVEMHFYMRNAKPADIEDFKKEKGLKNFGMPLYLGSGSHDYKGEKYRFIVMEKFGNDLWKLFLENDRSFPTSTVFKLAIQILDVLEYIHSRGYVHADIKGANILLGVTKETINKQAYLVDFGLATKFTTDEVFKPNPKKAHDGTIEYLSRDAHKGVQTMRGDLEILAYNIIQWLGCNLPWEKNLKDPNLVHKSKEEYMDSVPKLIKYCFGNKTPPGALVDFLNYLKTLKFNTAPDYKKIRKIFMSGIKDAGGSPKGQLEFSTKKTPLKRKSGQKLDSSPKRKVVRTKVIDESSEDEKENMDDDDVPMQEQESDSNDEDIIDERDEDEPIFKKTGTRNAKKKDDDKEVVLSSPKKRGRPKKNYKEDTETVETEKQKGKTKTIKNENTEKIGEVNPYEGYTDAMREVMKKKLQNGKSKAQKKIKQTVEDTIDDMNGYTDSMKELMLKKKERLGSKRTVRGKKTDLISAPSTSKH